jgi:hypothetical protein
LFLRWGEETVVARKRGSGLEEKGKKSKHPSIYDGFSTSGLR